MPAKGNRVNSNSECPINFPCFSWAFIRTSPCELGFHCAIPLLVFLGAEAGGGGIRSREL